MKDMFDDFMDELRRRQAEREAGEKKADGGSDEAESGPTDEGSAEDATMRSDGPGSDESDQDEEERPTPVFGRGGFGGGPGRPRRYSGGPSGEMPEIHIGRGWIVLGIAFLILMGLLGVFAMSIGFATDAIWFQSVGFGSVFWTRVGSQVLFFVVGLVVAFVFLWVNLWLAGRFIPKGQMRRFSLDDILDRFSVERYMGGGNFGSGPFGAPPRRTTPGEKVTVTPEVAHASTSLTAVMTGAPGVLLMSVPAIPVLSVVHVPKTAWTI